MNEKFFTHSEAEQFSIFTRCHKNIANTLTHTHVQRALQYDSAPSECIQSESIHLWMLQLRDQTIFFSSVQF